MADLVRAKDWSQTPLGPIQDWSPELVVSVNLVLSSTLMECVIWGPDRVQIYNDRFQSLLGIKENTQGGLFADNWAEVFDQASAALERTSATGETFHEENLSFVVHMGDELIEVLCTLTNKPIWADTEAGPQVVGIYQTVLDMTQSIVAGRQLRASEARANRILESIGDAVIVTDGAGNITRMNAVAERLTQWDFAAANGRPLPEIFQIVHETTRGSVEDPVDKVRRLQGVVGLANHTVLISRDGHETQIDDSAAPILDDRGELTGVVLVFRDVEERRTLERQTEAAHQELRTTHEKLQLAMEFTGQGSFSYDATTGLLSGDPVVQELFQQAEPANLPEDWIARVHQDDQQRVATDFAAAITGERPYNIEHRVVRSDGVRWIQARAKLLSKAGEPVVMTGISEDITLRKQQSDALRQTEKLAAVGKLAASIAHEINNPLESVTNLLYLARGSSDLQEVQAYLDTADRELRRVSVISSQTLRFHKQSSSPRALTCDELFENVLSIYQGRLVNSRIHVERRKRATEAITCFDGEIRQVLNNLVGNAIDAMHPDGGRLLLRSRNAHDWRSGRKGIVMTVADTGTGMTSGVAAKLFEAFYTTKGIGGTGLGLWVSKEIVDRHGGRLAFRSNQSSRGSGTVFTLFLPSEAVVR